MKKTTLLLLTFFGLAGFAQSKSTGIMTLNNGNPITANFTLNNDTSTVTLVLTGPADRWFGLGIGVADGFGMSAGNDVLVYTTALSDRNFIGFAQAPAVDANQSWTTVSNTVTGTIRTLTLTRSLTNSDPNDFQFPYATTNSISIGGARPASATTTIGGHSSAGFANGTFTTLGVEDFSLNAAAIYPNPSTGNFRVKSKTTLDRINIYSQTGAFMKTVEGDLGANELEINVEELPKGVYLIELQNASDKSWKKIIIN
jgi:hypothetical protein